MPQQSPPQVPIVADVRVPHDVPSTGAANWFHLARANDEIQLLVGYIDLRKAGEGAQAARIAGKTQVKLDVEISARFAMSMSGFLYLHRQVNELFSKMRDSGGVDFGDESPNPKIPNA